MHAELVILDGEFVFERYGRCRSRICAVWPNANTTNCPPAASTAHGIASPKPPNTAD
ncbi:MAG: hypothetical protein R2856_17265 [Caldilineaceae bacterium]